MELETLLLTYPVLGVAYKYKEGFLDAFTFEKNNEAVVCRNYSGQSGVELYPL